VPEIAQVEGKGAVVPELHDLAHGLELARLREHLPSSGRVLDFGAGAGQQALRLQEMGLEVHAVDLESSQYLKKRVFDVRNYDGQALPFPDVHFDLVVSSNVLEHVPDLSRMHAEIRRVLAPAKVKQSPSPATKSMPRSSVPANCARRWRGFRM